MNCQHAYNAAALLLAFTSYTMQCCLHAVMPKRAPPPSHRNAAMRLPQPTLGQCNSTSSSRSQRSIPIATASKTVKTCGWRFFFSIVVSVHKKNRAVGLTPPPPWGKGWAAFTQPHVKNSCCKCCSTDTVAVLSGMYLMQVECFKIVHVFIFEY